MLWSALTFSHVRRSAHCSHTRAMPIVLKYMIVIWFPWIILLPHHCSVIDACTFIPLGISWIPSMLSIFQNLLMPLSSLLRWVRVWGFKRVFFHTNFTWWHYILRTAAMLSLHFAWLYFQRHAQMRFLTAWKDWTTNRYLFPHFSTLPSPAPSRTFQCAPNPNPYV